MKNLMKFALATAEAEAAGKLACDAERMKELMECAAMQIYDPDAVPQLEN